MDCTILEDSGLDFNTIELSLHCDDTVRVSYDDGHCLLELPLYSHEAAALRDLLSTFADRPPQ